MHAFTFGYFVCTLLYFFPSFPFSSSLLRHLEVLHVYGGRFTCGHIQTKTDTGPIFSALQYRCVGSGHLGPQMEQKVCVFLCVDMCLCGLGLRAKLKVGVRGWGPVVETPSRELGIYGESGKNIPTVINQTSVTQMTRNNGSFSIHVTVSPPPHSHVPPTCATAPLALTARCPMRLARRSPSEIVIPSWLIGSLWLRSLSWRWGRMKRENRIMVDGGRVAGRKQGDRFLASQSARCSSWVHYDALQGIEMVAA